MQVPCPVRILGLDLGITSAHRGVVVDGEGQVLARRSAVPTVDSLAVLEAAALHGAAPGARILVVGEPTGPAWLTIAVFFGRRGHLVVRVSSGKAADLRRFLSRHAKTNGIDAETLARLPLVASDSLEPVELPGAARATLDRRVRAVARLPLLARGLARTPGLRSDVGCTGCDRHRLRQAFHKMGIPLVNTGVVMI